MSFPVVGGINLGCHGIPERCLVVRGKRMAICARCFGANIGHCLAVFCLIIQKLPPWYLAILLLVPLFIDWSLQEFAGIMSNHRRRLITGIVGGFGLASLLWLTILNLASLVIDRLFG